MYKLARSSRPAISGFRAIAVSRIAPLLHTYIYTRRKTRQCNTEHTTDQLQGTPINRISASQRRNLSIHEYLSADLLRQVRIASYYILEIPI